MQVQKRDGRIVNFDRSFIENAISQALKSVEVTDLEFPHHACSAACQKLEKFSRSIVSISEIQSAVESVLMKSRYPNVARAYIEYRHDRDQAREMTSDMTKQIDGLMNVTNDDIINENANKDGNVIPTQRDLLAGIVSKHYANHMIPKHIMQAHKSGVLHFHDLDYSPLFPMFNCFSRDTRFITSEGVKSFLEFDDGDRCVVPTHTGKWQYAVVKQYGYRSLNTVTMKRGKGTKQVKVTGNHRWILKDGSITTDLRVGDQLHRTPDLIQGEPQTKQEAVAWVRGFLYGDGTQVDTSVRCRICGPKLRHRHIFDMAGFNVTTPDCYDGDGWVCVTNLDKMDINLNSKAEIAAWVNGFVAADGGWHNGILKNIQQCNPQTFYAIEKYFDVAGYYLGGYATLTEPTNLGKRSSPHRRYNITRPQSHQYWTVESIDQDTDHEDVWCLEVEQDHSFILQGGVVTGNCMLIDIENMMTKGFRMGNAWIETPRSIGTACAVTAQIIAQVASHIYGGNTINRIDEVLAPYVTATHKKNLEFLAYAKCPDVERVAMEKTRKDVYDAIQALEYEVNTMHTANGQTPFCTFGFGLGDSWESALIQESILKIRMAGLGKDKHTAIFPKLVFAIKQGHNANPGDPLYRIKQLALECASKRMYPDIVSYEKIVEQTGSFKFPMGCRSFLHRWTDKDGKEIHEGRNNLGVVTLNLPRIALDSNGDPVKFMDLLDERMELIRQALQVRIDRLKGVKAKVAPILYVEGACGVRLHPEDYVMDIFVNKRASISAGYIGLHEVSEIMDLGDEHIFDSPAKQKFLVDVMERMKSWIQKWNDSSTFAYSLYGTPSESLCDRFCRLDKAVYGDVVPGIFEKGYYTNSFHLDVNKKVNPYEKMIFEKQFLPSTTGGFICYGEFPNMQHNLEALEDVWDFACANVPYYGTNTPIDRCFECGYEGEFEATSKGYQCPSCGNHDDKKMNVTRRVCGYLGSPGSRPFNAGKQCEVQRRVKHL